MRLSELREDSETSEPRGGQTPLGHHPAQLTRSLSLTRSTPPMARSGVTASGVWKKDSVKDVAESVGIANLPDDVATALAGDVEYRLCQIIEVHPVSTLHCSAPPVLPPSAR